MDLFRSVACLAILAFASPLWAADADVVLFLAKVQGKVTVTHGKKSHTGKPPESLVQGDKVATGADSNAYLEFKNGSVVEVGSKTSVTVKQLAEDKDSLKTRFLLAWGKFKAQVKKLATSSSSFEVEAGGVVTGVRGTVFGVDYDKDQKKVSAQTFEGSIFTRVKDHEEVIDKGYGAVVKTTGLAVKSPLTGAQMDSFKDFENVSNELEQKKQELLGQLHGQVMEKVPGGILPQQQEDDVKKTIGDKLPF
ncbi:MAG TPA: FecR family protein [bacterium]|nr:FecR family protein [bacterium]